MLIPGGYMYTWDFTANEVIYWNIYGVCELERKSVYCLLLNKEGRALLSTI